MRHSDCVSRFCSRCGRPLEDAASRECGVGPVCRQKDNAIFARQIEAKLTLSVIQAMDLEASNFHAEIAGEYEAVKMQFLEKVARLRREVGDPSLQTLAGADFRFFVDWLDRSLSYPCSASTRTMVISLIENLGYASLASVLRGDACMSKAKLYVQNNRIYLKGKSNKAGWHAFKNAFPGGVVTLPRYRGDKTPYSVHVAHADKFIEIALRHWPFMENIDSIDDTIVLCKNLAKHAPVEESRTEASINKQQNGWFNVSAPWVGTRQEMMDMIAKFKQVHYKDRTFSYADKKWRFKNAHIATIKSVLEETKLYNVVLNECQKES